MFSGSSILSHSLNEQWPEKIQRLVEKFEKVVWKMSVGKESTKKVRKKVILNQKYEQSMQENEMLLKYSDKRQNF